MPGARNNGIEQSCGEYIVFLDADDELLPNALECIVNSFEKCQAEWIITDTIRKDCKGEKIEQAIFSESDQYMNLLRKNMYFQAHFFRKKKLLEIGMYDLSQLIYEDWEIMIRYLKQGISFFYLDKALYIYKVRNDSISKENNYKKKLFYIERIYRKHYKPEAENGNKEIAKLYALYMWRLSSDYFHKYKDIAECFRCFKESFRYDYTLGFSLILRKLKFKSWREKAVPLAHEVMCAAESQKE